VKTPLIVKINAIVASTELRRLRFITPMNGFLNLANHLHHREPFQLIQG
jgi:hypothetical protein